MLSSTVQTAFVYGIVLISRALSKDRLFDLVSWKSDAWVVPGCERKPAPVGCILQAIYLTVFSILSQVTIAMHRPHVIQVLTTDHY